MCLAMIYCDFSFFIWLPLIQYALFVRDCVSFSFFFLPFTSLCHIPESVLAVGAVRRRAISPICSLRELIHCYRFCDIPGHVSQSLVTWLDGCSAYRAVVLTDPEFATFEQDCFKDIDALINQHPDLRAKHTSVFVSQSHCSFMSPPPETPLDALRSMVLPTRPLSGPTLPVRRVRVYLSAEALTVHHIATGRWVDSTASAHASSSLSSSSLSSSSPASHTASISLSSSSGLSDISQALALAVQEGVGSSPSPSVTTPTPNSSSPPAEKLTDGLFGPGALESGVQLGNDQPRDAVALTVHDLTMVNKFYRSGRASLAAVAMSRMLLTFIKLVEKPVPAANPSSSSSACDEADRELIHTFLCPAAARLFTWLTSSTLASTSSTSSTMDSGEVKGEGEEGEGDSFITALTSCSTRNQFIYPGSSVRRGWACVRLLLARGRLDAERIMQRAARVLERHGDDSGLDVDLMEKLFDVEDEAEGAGEGMKDGESDGGEDRNHRGLAAAGGFFSRHLEICANEAVGSLTQYFRVFRSTVVNSLSSLHGLGVTPDPLVHSPLAADVASVMKVLLFAACIGLDDRTCPTVAQLAEIVVPYNASTATSAAATAPTTHASSSARWREATLDTDIFLRCVGSISLRPHPGLPAFLGEAPCAFVERDTFVWPGDVLQGGVSSTTTASIAEDEAEGQGYVKLYMPGMGQYV